MQWLWFYSFIKECQLLLHTFFFVYQFPRTFLSIPSFLASLLASFITLAFKWSLYAMISPSHLVTVCFSHIQIWSATWKKGVFFVKNAELLEHSRPENFKKSRQKNSWNQINQFHELFLNIVHENFVKLHFWQF